MKSKNAATRGVRRRLGWHRKRQLRASFGIGPSTRTRSGSSSAIAVGSGPMPTPDFTAYIKPSTLMLRAAATLASGATCLSHTTTRCFFSDTRQGSPVGAEPNLQHAWALDAAPGRIGRYSHAHQFNRARRALKFLRIRLGRVVRDIRRKIAGNQALTERFADLLALAMRVRFQDHRQRGPKVYSLHAPEVEVECIGKGKARAPYEFGCKVSIATPATKPKGGQFVLHAKALHGNPFDGHTLGPVIADLEKRTGVETRRIHVDKGYRGHNNREKFRVWITG